MNGLDINGQVLKWLRVNFQLEETDVARKMGIKSVERYRKIEGGKIRPTLRQIRKLSYSLKIPVTAFYLDKPPKNWTLPTDYRSRTDSRLNVKTILAIRRARLIQSFMAEFDDWQRTQLERFLNQSPESASRTLRKQLGYMPSQRLSKENLRDRLRLFIESLGIVSLILSIPKDDMRGFCLDGAPPVVVASNNDQPAGQIFTLLHELYHVIHHQAGICQPLSYKSHNTDEQACNTFAASFLITPEELRVSLTDKTDKSDATLKEIADQHKTSREVILIRMIDQKLATWEDYNARSKQWQAEYKKLEKENFYPPADPIKKVWREYGESVTTKVMEQLVNENISQGEAASYLNVKSSYVDYVGERSVLKV